MKGVALLVFAFAAQYIDVGLNIDCHDVVETPNGLDLALAVEVSATAKEVDPNRLPLIRQYKWDSGVSVPLGKPTSVFSDSDSSSQYRIDVKVTATPLDSR